VFGFHFHTKDTAMHLLPTSLRKPIRLALATAGLTLGFGAQAGLLTFEAATSANNASTYAAWLAATGAATAQHTANFESGFAANQNISGVGGLFGGGLVITDTSAAGQAIVRSGAAVINGSNPIGTFALTHNEQAFLQFDFSAAPVSYFGAYSIDQAGTNVMIDFVDGSSASFSIATTNASGDSAEFFGFVSQGGPLVNRIRFDANGDGRWGLDNLAYGTVPEPGSLALAGLAFIVMAGARRGRSCKTRDEKRAD
jgi:hypothetical protein